MGIVGLSKEFIRYRGGYTPYLLESFGIGLEGTMFLQAEEEISIRRIVQAIRGDIGPIVQEQEQLRQDI